jgi:hypothetical protein
MFEVIKSAHAESLTTDPTQWNFALWFFIFLMSLPGGFANWVSRGIKKGWSWRGVLELLKDVMCSASVAVIAFMGAMTQTDSIMIAAIASGICAHLAPRLIFSGNTLVEVGTNKYLKRLDPGVKLEEMPADEPIMEITQSQIDEMVKKAIDLHLNDNLLDK